MVGDVFYWSIKFKQEIHGGKMRRLIITSIILLTALPAFASSPSISVTADPTVSNKFVRHTVTGITTPVPQLPDVPGFWGYHF